MAGIAFLFLIGFGALGLASRHPIGGLAAVVCCFLAAGMVMGGALG